MPVDRLLPSEEAADLIALARDIADKVLAPIVDADEKAESYPEGVFRQLGAAGLLSLPQPEQWGGGDQPYEVYLQVLEEIAARWAAVAVAVSVHSLSCHPLLAFGSDEQRRRWLPGMSSGTCGKPRSCRSSRAPTRFSVWSSPGRCPRNNAEWRQRVQS